MGIGVGRRRGVPKNGGESATPGVKVSVEKEGVEQDRGGLVACGCELPPHPGQHSSISERSRGFPQLGTKW